MKEVTKTFTVTASDETVMQRFERFLMLLQVNGNIGHSGKFGMPLDGDGPERIDVAEFKSRSARGSLPFEVEAINGAGYDVVLAFDNSYSGIYRDRDRESRYWSGPAGNLYKDGEIRHTYPSKDWSHTKKKRKSQRPTPSEEQPDSSPPEWPGPKTVKEGQTRFPDEAPTVSADTNAGAEYHALRDVESFCRGRRDTGVCPEVYRDIEYMVKQHRKRLEKETGGVMDGAEGTGK